MQNKYLLKNNFILVLSLLRTKLSFFLAFALRGLEHHFRLFHRWRYIAQANELPLNGVAENA